MPYCTNCGSKVTVEMLFCSQCGSKLIIPAADTTSNKAYEDTTGTKVDNQEVMPSRETTLSRVIRRGKLYKQWVKYAGLPAEEIPSVKTPRAMPVREESNARPSRLMYILFAVGVLLCVGLAIFLVRIW